MAQPSGRKRKRVSKNKKKNWRKHTDVEDVEQFLEDTRLQERTGGLVAEKDDDQLFFVDKEKTPASTTLVTKKTKKDLSELKLKCHALLEPDPNIKPVFVVTDKRNHRNTISKRCDRVQKKQRDGILSKKELSALHQRVSTTEHRRSRRNTANHRNIASFDLWAAHGSAEEPGLDDFYLQQTRRKPVKVPAHRSARPSGLPVVEVAPPGASYNPTYEDHQALLRAAHTEELYKEKEEARIKRALDDMFPTKDNAPTEASHLLEMSAGLCTDEEEEDDSNSEDAEADDRLTVNPPVRREDKKTEKQRRKDAEHKQSAKNKTEEAEEKKYKKELFRLKAIKNEVHAHTMVSKARAKRKAQLQEKFKDKPKKLGRLKFETPEMEIKLSDELQGSLRLLKPEGHLLEDRFKSLQKRNVIESRKRAKVVKKYKRKKFPKKSHREVTA